MLDYFIVLLKSHHLVLLGPVIVNILMFHVLMAPAGLPPGLVAAIFWPVVFVRHRAAFTGIFAARLPEQG